MKQALYILIMAASFVACSKDRGQPPGNDKHTLSFDSLITLSTNIPPGVYSDLTFINDTTGFATSRGFVVKTTDGGNSWKSTTVPGSGLLKQIQFTNDKVGYMIGGDGDFAVLCKTTDAGKTWVVTNLNALELPYGLCFINNNTGFITGKNLFIKTTDGGQTWTSVKSSGFRNFQDVQFRNSQEGIATSSDGVYFKTTNGGVTWDSLRYNAANYLYDIHFTETRSFVVKSPDSLVDINNNFAITLKPSSSHKLLFFNDKKSIGIGAHFKLGFYPYGDIFITNNGWKNFEQKTFSTTIAMDFSAIAKMNANKAMIIGAGFSGTQVMVIQLK